jgi:hypothetical protein
MTSLREYVTHEFPEHTIDPIESDQGDLQLTDHTVVSYAVGRHAGDDLVRAYRESAPQARVAALRVRPTNATVLPTDHEDADGVLDLPMRRVATFVVGGFLVVGAIVGGSRFAGQRATTQPRAPGRTVTVVAAFLDDDASAAPLARAVGPAADYEVRIVDHQGAWRSPGTVTNPE